MPLSTLPTPVVPHPFFIFQDRGFTISEPRKHSVPMIYYPDEDRDTMIIIARLHLAPPRSVWLCPPSNCPLLPHPSYRKPNRHLCILISPQYATCFNHHSSVGLKEGFTSRKARKQEKKKGCLVSRHALVLRLASRGPPGFRSATLTLPVKSQTFPPLLLLAYLDDNYWGRAPLPQLSWVVLSPHHYPGWNPR